MIEGLPCFQMKQRKDIADLHIEGELFSLVIGKNPLAVLLGQVVHAGRVLLGKCQFKEQAGGFGGEAVSLRDDDPGPDFGFCQRCHSGLHGYLRDWVSRSWYHKAQRYGTSGAIHVSQVAESWGPIRLAPSAPPTDWLQLVNQPQTEAEVAALRCCLNRGRAFGHPNWVTDTTKRLGLESTI